MRKKQKREYCYEGSFFDKNKTWLGVVAGGMLGFVAILVVAAFCVCSSGCATSRTRRNAGDIRLSDSYILGGIENAVSNFDDGIGRAVRESKGIANEVDRLEFLFNRYEQHALRLRDEVNNLRAEIKNARKDNLDSGDSNSN